MAVESPRATGPIDGVNPNSLVPQIREVSPGLRKSALTASAAEGKKLPERIWKDRSLAVEEYIQSVLETQIDFVAKVELDLVDRDSKGPDFKIIFVKDFPTPEAPLAELLGEGKSSPETVAQYKHKLRDEYLEEQIYSTMIGPWHPDALALEMGKKRREWQRKTNREIELIISGILTKKGIILINGGVGTSGTEKTPEKILYNSFYPQLFRYIEAQRPGIPLEQVYGRFYPQVAAIKQIVLERQLSGRHNSAA